jgi:hypothetical protein
MVAERRKERSSDTREAANLYLEAAAQRREFQALALANTEGEVIAEASSTLNASALAAIAPFALEGIVPTDGLLQFVTRGEMLRLWNIDLGGELYHLMGVGGEALTSTMMEQDLVRILTHE